MDLFETGAPDKIKKLAVFEEELINFLKIAQNNQSIYTFALEKGICLSKAREVLLSLEKAKRLTFSGDNRQKGAFYLKYNPEKKIYIQSK